VGGPPGPPGQPEKRGPLPPRAGYRPDAGSPYEWLSYSQVFSNVEGIGSAIANAGLKKQDKVGVFGANSPEWMTAMQACNRMGYVTVPVYDTLGHNAVEFILNHAGTKIVFVEGKKLKTLAEALNKTPSVKDVVFWGTVDEASRAAVPSSVRVSSFPDFLAAGKAATVPADPPKEGDLSTIMYTSGTTGDPKGVTLTHRNLINLIFALIHMTKQAADIEWSDDVLVSYLPLAHIFQRVNEEMMTYCGCAIGYWRGDITGLLDDIKHLTPTFFPGVPRVFDRIYTKVMAGIEPSFVKRFLYNWLFGRKKALLQDGADPLNASPLADGILFKKVKAALGGKVRCVVSGGAPIAKHTEEFCRVAFGAKFVQGYGLTETCAASFLNADSWDGFFQTVGFPLPGLEFCLESVPEMGYDATAQPPRGEVLIRGPTVFGGYYKDSAKTSEAFSGEWFRTGDVGEVQANGSLKIIDRAKNIFKLAQGEYVSSENIESVFKKNPVLDQVFVYGESTEQFIVAVVVPGEAPLMKWAAANGVKGSFQEVCASPEANKYVLEQITATSEEAKLRRFEFVKKVSLTPEAFTPDNDLLTPSFKLRRPQLKKRYLSEIKAMYGH